jgi:multidrug efflux system membrane fusion protein
MSNIKDLVNFEQFAGHGGRGGAIRALFGNRRRAALLAGTAALLLVAGAIYQRSAADAPPAVADMAVAVSARVLAPQSVRIWSEFSGRLTAVDAADIRPEVSGRITEVRFKDGQTVHAGDILFVIDPRPYDAAVAKAEADLATANTNARLTRLLLDRNKSLLDVQALARNAYDQSVNANGVAVAAIQAAEAELTQAKLDIDRAHVKAPITGRVSRAEIMVGNLVQAGPNAPLLTSIVSGDGIYADFDVDEQTYLRSVHRAAQTQNQEARIPVQMTLQGDSDHVYQGRIESFDNKIDPGTGTIRARARFDNADGVLVPGMFASIKLGSSVSSTVLLVPDDAVGNDQSKRFVYVVAPGNKAAFREVTLGQEVGGERVVLSGLKPGERVITDGLQRLQPDSIVRVDNTPAPHQFAAK